MCKHPYPANWSKASRILRRVVAHCERCGSTEALTVHHLGAPYPDGRHGDKADKRDLRRENLQVLCEPCHRRADYWRCLRHYRKYRAAQRKLAQHRALGVGTGLVLVRPME
jgi:5-methylcytosine-specific restriction endonuclease McrA